MSLPPESSSGSSVPSSNPHAASHHLLEAGLAALKQGNYATAIAHLQATQQTPPDRTSGLRASMGLVVAYERQGEIEQAIALCQSLCQNSSRRVNTWATQTLAGLSDRYPEAFTTSVSPSNSVAEIPNDTPAIASEISTESGSEQKRSVQVDPTGFVPLGSNSSDSRKNPFINSFEEDLTRFVPLGESSQNPVSSDRSHSTAKPALGDTDFQNPFDAQSSNAQSATGQAHAVGQSLTERVESFTDAEAAVPSQTVFTDPQAETTTKSELSDATTTSAVGVANFDHPFLEENPFLEQETTTEAKAGDKFRLRQAERAQRWQPLGTDKPFKLWFVQIGTAIALVWFIRTLLSGFMGTTNWILNKTSTFTGFYPIQVFYTDPTKIVLVSLVLLFCLSPWLLDGLLKLFYGLKPLSTLTLTKHSPEAARVIKRVAGQNRWSIPTLGILPTAAPLALTYGLLPRTARIVVSQGLLNRLADDEIATIYAAELGHIAHWDFAVMSWLVLVTQLPYVVYWQVAEWGTRQANSIVRGLTGIISAIAYGFYWLFRLPGLWLARLRLYYSDRTAAELTGNPNGLTRALLKIAIGIAQDIQQQSRTSYLLEGFDLLVPVGHREATHLGSLLPFTPVERLLEWDQKNPYRQWLNINNSHPLMGDRLQQLARYARHWRLKTELDLEVPSRTPASIQNWQPLLLQGAPYFGILFGLAIAGALWLSGGIAILLNWERLTWLAGDRPLVFACLLTGCSIGTLLRINPFFPDLKPTTLQVNPPLDELLTDSAAIPLDSQPVRLQGQLVGRKGVGNWLGQDLLLQTATGLVKLHCFSQLGPFGNLAPQPVRPDALISRSISITGWFRRGGTVWIDVDTLQTQGGKISRFGHPAWSTILVCLMALAGAYIILLGGA